MLDIPAALYLARHYSDRTLRKLGQLAGMQYPAVTIAIRRFAERSKSHNMLAEKPGA